MESWTGRDILSYKLQNSFLQNTVRLNSGEIIFPVKHYESVFDILTNIHQFFEVSINEYFNRIFGKYIKKYEGQIIELFN